MRSFFSCIKYMLWICLFSFAFFSCATIPVLNITYGTVPKPSMPDSKEICFKFIDQRANKDIIGPGAQGAYKGYSGKINFMVSKEEEGEHLVGVYDVKPLFEKVFSMYLGNAGLTVLSEPKEGIPELSIRLNDFTLDLSGRKWIASIAYEAEFIKEGKTITRKFKGRAERYRVYGLDQAHQVMSEAFTDIVNQLDIKDLFAGSAG
jgi:hypothetical protein